MSESLKSDPEICLAAIESGGIDMLQYCSEPLRRGGLLEYANSLVRIRSGDFFFNVDYVSKCIMVCENTILEENL